MQRSKFGIWSGSIFVQNFVNSFKLVTYLLQIDVGVIGKGKTSKKAKAEPTREEMHAVVVDILKKVDFNTVSYNAYFPVFVILDQSYASPFLRFLCCNAGNTVRYSPPAWYGFF